MARRKRQYRTRTAALPQWGRPVWHREAGTAVVSSVSSQRIDYNLFDPETQVMPGFPVSAAKAALIRRIIIRVMAAATSSAVSQLLSLIVSLLLKDKQAAGSGKEYNSTIATVTDTTTRLLAKEIRTIGTGAGGIIGASLDAGNVPMTIDLRTNLVLRPQDRLVLNFEGYASAFAALPAVTSIGSDFEFSILWSKSTGL